MHSNKILEFTINFYIKHIPGVNSWKKKKKNAKRFLIYRSLFDSVNFGV